ncbi:MAG: hypothetical protein ABIQ88_02375 [Chitinophagaceae bacterium]
MCNKEGTKRFRVVEVICKANQNEYSLLTDDILNSAKRIVAIEAYRVANVSLTPSSLAVVNDTVFAKSFLTMSTAATDEMLNRIPFTDLDRKANQGELFFVDIPPIVASKCKVFIPTTVGIVAGEAWLIGVHYE